jgi:hypothetical protein
MTDKAGAKLILFTPPAKTVFFRVTDKDYNQQVMTRQTNPTVNQNIFFYLVVICQ